MGIFIFGVRNEDLVQALLLLNQKNIRHFLIQFINLSKTIAADFSRAVCKPRNHEITKRNSEIAKRHTFSSKYVFLSTK